MPGGDGTGPLGRGALSGRRLGPCAGAAPAGYWGRGAGFSRRRGYGGCYPPYVVEDKELLEMQKRELQLRLEVLEKQLADMSQEDE